MAKHSGPTPSTPLSFAAEAWFRDVANHYALEEHHVRLLTAACRMWDRAEAARETIEKHGATFTDRFGAPRPRPEVAIERNSLNSFRQMIHEIGLDEEAPAATRVRGAKGVGGYAGN